MSLRDMKNILGMKMSEMEGEKNQIVEYKVEGEVKCEADHGLEHEVIVQ
jgi:hypothetical protein